MTDSQSSLSKNVILERLNSITSLDGVPLGISKHLKALRLQDGQISFVIEMSDPSELAFFTELEKKARVLLEALEGVAKVSIAMSAPVSQETSAKPDQNKSLKIGRHPLPQKGKMIPDGVQNILAIASGKGGVGKSTVTSNLAVTLAQMGRRVGILDADVYGPSQPKMLGVHQSSVSQEGSMIIPAQAHGVTMMSIGMMVPEGEAIVWRGPMLMGAMQQMLGEVRWGELDVLLIDMPPGTGDVQLTFGQKAKLSGALVVSTPQDISLIDARRAMSMFEKLKVPVLGLIENMSMYSCPQCGHQSHPFGVGGVVKEAESLNTPLLAQLPLTIETRRGGDLGAPAALEDKEIREPYEQLATRLIAGGFA